VGLNLANQKIVKRKLAGYLMGKNPAIDLKAAGDKEPLWRSI
jgi:hypothetical protein